MPRRDIQRVGDADRTASTGRCDVAVLGRGRKDERTDATEVGVRILSLAEENPNRPPPRFVALARTLLVTATYVPIGPCPFGPPSPASIPIRMIGPPVAAETGGPTATVRAVTEA